MTKPRLSAGSVILALSLVLAVVLAAGFVIKLTTPLLNDWRF